MIGKEIDFFVYKLDVKYDIYERTSLINEIQKFYNS